MLVSNVSSEEGFVPVCAREEWIVTRDAPVAASVTLWSVGADHITVTRRYSDIADITTALRVTGQFTRTAVFRQPLGILKTPPKGSVGVTINNAL